MSTDSHPFEEGPLFRPEFEKLKKVAALPANVLPVVVQDADTGEVLILAYANSEALAYSQTHRIAAFWSTSRNELWIKGATSGDTLDLVEIRVNCEQNALLYKVRPRKTGACHTRNQKGETRGTCFYRTLTPDGLENLDP